MKISDSLPNVREIVKGWVGPILVFFGPPGAPKQRLIGRLIEPNDTLILDTTGLNVSLNSLLLRTPGVEFCEICSTLTKCLKTINKLTNNTLEDANSRDIQIALVNQYYSLYNTKSKWKFRLPQTRSITIE